MSDSNLDFEVRVRLRRNATPRTIIAEMVAEGFDEVASKQAMDRFLAVRNARKRNGIGMMVGGGLLGALGLVITIGSMMSFTEGGEFLVVTKGMIVVGFGLAIKGGVDAFSF